MLSVLYLQHISKEIFAITRIFFVFEAFTVEKYVFLNFCHVYERF